MALPNEALNVSPGFYQDKVLKDMDEQEEMKTFSSSEEETDTDEEVENERRLQRALLEKDKVSLVCFPQSRKIFKTCSVHNSHEDAYSISDHIALTSLSGLFNCINFVHNVRLVIKFILYTSSRLKG